MKLPKVKTHTFALVLLAIFFILGLFIYKDYGISWDEPIQRKLGIDNYNYVTRVDKELLKNSDRLYGPSFELFLIILEKISGTKNPQKIYYLRHLATFSLYFASVVTFYFLCRDYFKKDTHALLATLLLIISPRIFAHSFYNSKDIPNLALFTINIFVAHKYFQNKNKMNATILGATTACLLTIRLTGIIIPLFIVFI